MNRQIQIGGVFFNLSTTREYQVGGLYVNEEDAAVGGDPEGSLIGGKLIRGGLLLHGVLGR
jgi:hypothetical protein